MFDLHQFASLTPDWYSRLSYFTDLDSTNDQARVLAEKGACHGTLVLAEHQRAGRGRRGASWVSAPGDGLLFSLILRPTFSKSSWGRLALASGLGMVTALRHDYAVSAHVKWPNDIYLDGRKCAGILTEAREGYVILGIGLNVFSSPNSESSSMPAIALSDATEFHLTREKLLATLLDAILLECDNCAEGFPEQLERLREVCFLSGKDIEFAVNGMTMSGKVNGFDDHGALVVEQAGELKAYPQAAEIRVTGSPGSSARIRGC